MEKLESYLTQQPHRQDDTRTRREVAYERIKDALQHAGLQPGAPLSEQQLSKLLGISRTPVREALQQLAQEGLVQVIPGRAVMVASRSLKDVLDVVHMRWLLEPELARLAAESASDEQVMMLQDAIKNMESALLSDDYAAWSKADSVYHTTIREACPNQLLGEIIVQLHDRVHHLADRDSKHNPERLVACTAEHRRVAEAISNHDTREAEQAMREHLVKLRESMFSRLSYG